MFIVHLVQCTTKECEEHIQLVQWQVGLVKKSNYTIVEIQEYKNMYPTNTHLVLWQIAVVKKLEQFR